MEQVSRCRADAEWVPRCRTGAEVPNGCRGAERVPRCRTGAEVLSGCRGAGDSYSALSPLAGEHTNIDNGTESWSFGCVHSAFESGQRAGKAIRDQLCPSESSIDIE